MSDRLAPISAEEHQLWPWALSLCIVTLLGACNSFPMLEGGEKSPRTQTKLESLSERKAEESTVENVRESSTARLGAALPAFIDGGLRCGVQTETRRPRGRLSRPLREDSWGARLWRGGLLHSTSPGQVATPSEARCSAPRPWCLLFGPSKADKSAFNRQLRFTRALQRKTERVRELNEQLARAQESIEAERRSRLDQLRKLTKNTDEGVYLTNDDSMSLASPQRLLWAIDHGEPLPANLVRPHELLNYFSFDTEEVQGKDSFSVLADLSPHPARPGDVTLALSVKGRSFNKNSRRNANLTFVIDRSESMALEGRLDQLKIGLLRSLSELKEGDIVQLLLFDQTTCALAQNFVVGRDPLSRLRSLIRSIEPAEGSNLVDGVNRGYAAVNRLFQADYSNRVILMTDEHGSPASEEQELISLSAKNFDSRRVRLSAVGLGSSVNDGLLERLTEAGKGAHLFLSSRREAEVIFGERFPSLIETIATDVHFKLRLPPSLELRAFYGKGASQKKEQVRSLHYFSGTEQMYLANLVQLGPLAPEDRVRLSIEYEDPDSGQARLKEFSWPGAELLGQVKSIAESSSRNLEKARMVAIFGYQLRYMAQKFGDPLSAVPGRSSYEGASLHCKRVQGRLDEFSALLQGESEARRITTLWRSYCERFSEERQLPPQTTELRLALEQRAALSSGTPGLDWIGPEGLIDGSLNEFPPRTFDY